MKSKKFARAAYLIPLGFAAGAVNGLFGCGGGIISVAAFSAALKGERSAERSARDVFAMTVLSVVPMSLSSAFVYGNFGAIPTDGMLGYLVPALIGGAAGALLLDRINTRVLKKIFAALIIYSGARMVLS